jgi:PAS domain S-box-containing protein
MTISGISGRNSRSPSKPCRRAVYKLKHIRTAYLSAVAINALLGLLAVLLMMKAASTEKDTLNAIQLNTNQQLQLQRITLLLTLLTHTSNPYEHASLHQELSGRLDQLETLHAAFVEQSTFEALPHEIDRLYFAPQTGMLDQLGSFVSLSHRLANETTPFSSEHPDFQRLLLLSPLLQRQYNSALVFYLQLTQSQVITLQLLAGSIFAGLLLVLLLEVVLIFRPMERAIGRQHGSLQDEIRQRRDMEAALHHSEQLYRKLTQNLPEMAVVLFDHDQRILLAEGEFLETIRVPPQLLEAKGLSEVMPEDTYRDFAPHFQAALSGQKSEMEHVVREYIFKTHFAPLYDEAGQVVGGMVVAHDVTARRRAEEQLRISEQQYRLLAENMTDVIWLLDTATMKIIYVSPSVQRLLGYTPAEALALGVEQLMTAPFLPSVSADLPGHIAAFLKGDPNRVTQTTEIEQPRKDGSTVWIELVTTFFKDQTGAVQILGVARDITERHRLQEMQTEQLLLETILQNEVELSALKSRMMVRITHEFRTPLSVILALTETLERYYERLTGEQRAAKRRTIRAQIRLITQMLDDMSLVVQSSRVPERMGRESVELSARCREAVALASKDAPRVTFMTEIVDHLMVRGDGAMLQRVVEELVKNAAQFSAPGDTVHVTLRPVETQVELMVHDQGIGILEQELGRVFEPFFRGSNIDEVRGLGLGLAMVYTLIQAHNGSIAISSEVNVGTTVTVTLPRVVQAAG